MSYDMSAAVNMEMDQHQEGVHTSFVERGRWVCRFPAVHVAFSRSTDSAGGWDKCSLSTNGLLMIPDAFYIRRISRQKLTFSQRPVKHMSTVGVLALQLFTEPGLYTIIMSCMIWKTSLVDQSLKKEKKIPPPPDSAGGLYLTLTLICFFPKSYQ